MPEARGGKRSMTNELRKEEKIAEKDGTVHGASNKEDSYDARG